MNSPRYEWKVGLFAVTGLAFLAILLLQFSKGLSFLTPTYELKLITANVGAIKTKASVLMAGIQIGQVSSADLNPDGRLVTIKVKIYRRYPIKQNAIFVIDQAGFLGDQYVSITPGDGDAPNLQDGAVVKCHEPFNLQEAARSATDLLKKFEITADAINQSVKKVDRILLAEQNLIEITNIISNGRMLSEKINILVDDLHLLMNTNQMAISMSMSNLASISQRIDQLAQEMQTFVETNRNDWRETMVNLRNSSQKTSLLLEDLQGGKGLAGSLLKDPQLDTQFKGVFSNLNQLSSNLNRYGLLYKPKPIKTNRIAKPLFIGKNPLE
jgi:phospholipid/cholesterol/gamma-HCH transport system substrate-binding protein